MIVSFYIDVKYDVDLLLYHVGFRVRSGRIYGEEWLMSWVA